MTSACVQKQQLKPLIPSGITHFRDGKVCAPGTKALQVERAQRPGTLEAGEQNGQRSKDVERKEEPFTPVLETPRSSMP